MKIAMINGSPKLTIRKNESCASRSILLDAKRYLRKFRIYDMEDYHVKTSSLNDEELKALFECDEWIFSFPIYAGGIPSHLLRFLMKVEELTKKTDVKAIHIYAIVNGGLYEGNESLPSLSTMRIWSEKCGFHWCGGIGIGGGPLYADSGRIYLNLTRRRSYSRKLSALCEAISQGNASLNTFCSPDMSKTRYILYMNRLFKKMARENGLSALDLDKQA